MNKKIIWNSWISLIIPFIYSMIRIYFITSDSDELYAMANYWTYIQIFIEILSFSIIVPTIYKMGKKKYEYEKDSMFNLSMLYTFATTIIIFIVVASFSPFLTNEMKNINENNDGNINEMYAFLFLTTSGLTISLFSKVLSYFIMSDKSSTLIIYALLNLVTYIMYDLIFLSGLTDISIVVF